VLVVDDDSLVLANTVAMLEELGHFACAASSAQEALDLMHGEPLRHQLLLTDHAMPRMTGAELVGAVKAQRPELPIVLASGYAELNSDLPPTVARLTKPFGLQELERAIADSVERAGPN